MTPRRLRRRTRIGNGPDLSWRSDAGSSSAWVRRHTAVLGLSAAVVGVTVLGIIGRTAGTSPHPAGYVSLAADPNSPPLALAAAPARTATGGSLTVRLVTSQPGRSDDVADGTADLARASSTLTVRTPAGTAVQHLTSSSAAVDSGSGPRTVRTSRSLAVADDPAVPVDPTLALQLLGGVTASVSPPARDSVGGAVTSRYTATVNLDRTAAQNTLPPAVLAGLRRQVASADVAVEVWTDSAGAVRRAVITLDPAAGRTLTLTLAPGASPS